MTEKLTIIRASDLSGPPPPCPKRRVQRISLDDSRVKLRGDALGDEWWRGAQWSVTTDGIECRDGCYFIAKDRLLENLPGYSWPEHMADKGWVDIDEFTTAWLVGLVLHGYSSPEMSLPQLFAKLRPRRVSDAA